MFVVVPLKSGDGGRDDDVSTQTRSKSKSEKTKGHSSSEPSPKMAKGASTRDTVSLFLSKN